ncbi:MAG TPA: ABC transporter permease [Steroidobacteraceae bacterium]|nr:ABC transporter permease [Steroidobacteraceae bacterium]
MPGSTLIRQVVAVTVMNLRTVPARAGTALVSVIGIGGVVAVLVAVLSISEGFRATLALAGREDIGIVLRGGSADELSSGLSLAAVRHVMDAPGIARGPAGALASPELYVIVDVPMRSTGTPANVPLRGVGPNAAPIRKAFRLVEGRDIHRGLGEIIVGKSAAAQFAGLEVGRKLRFGRTGWTVVGIFEDGGSVSESELWTDAIELQAAYNRGTSYQSVRVRLPAPGQVAALEQHLRSDPRFDLTVRTERKFYADQSSLLVAIVRTVGSLIALLMGAGAVFAALNTMYAAVASRTREIATLRAIGFGAAPVVASVLTESLLLGLAGGILGGAAAYLGFNGFQANTMNWQSFSQVSFAFAVTPALLATGIFYALVLGLLGGLLPGLRAARMPITAGLREL